MTTVQEISQWFDDGKNRNATHMLVVCDTFSHEDYPVYAVSDEQCKEKYKEFHGKDMQRVMEVYDLSQDKNEQLSSGRAFRMPG